jgi:long-subunit fatty acid transport protein
MLYKIPLADKKTVAFGATYSFKVNLNTERSRSLQILNSAGEPFSGTDYSNYQYFEEEGLTTIPGKLSTGVSFYKANKWGVSLDYSYQDWSQFEQYKKKPNNLVANNALKVGGEFTPNITNGEKYFQRITYRAGIYFDNGPVKINTQQINSFGITFGITAPISRISNINIGAELGQRGTLEQSLVKENYFGINLSFTYNDRWFLRRQFD